MSFISSTLDKNQQTAMARLFSSAVLKELAKNGRSPLFSRLVLESGTLDSKNLDLPISSVFDSALAILKKENNRHEYAYKAAITKSLLLGRHSLKTASLVSEFRVDKCKADIAIFNGTSTAYEIKSERDSLNRLENQLNTYKKFFAKVYVVTGEKHLTEVLNSTPADVGVLQLNKRHRISLVRECIENYSRLEPEVIFDSIQLKEALGILSALSIEPPALPNTQIRTAIKNIFSQLDPNKIHPALIKTLRSSRSSTALNSLLPMLPQSLYAALFSMPLKVKEREMLIASTQTSIREALTWAR